MTIGGSTETCGAPPRRSPLYRDDSVFRADDLLSQCNGEGRGEARDVRRSFSSRFAWVARVEICRRGAWCADTHLARGLWLSSFCAVDGARRAARAFDDPPARSD